MPQPGQVLQCLEPSEQLRGPKKPPKILGHTQPCMGKEGKWCKRMSRAEQASGWARQVKSNESRSFTQHKNRLKM